MNTTHKTLNEIEIGENESDELRQALENFNAAVRDWNEKVQQANEKALTPEPPAPESLPAKIATVWLAWTALVVIVIGLAAVLIG